MIKMNKYLRLLVVSCGAVVELWAGDCMKFSNELGMDFVVLVNPGSRESFYMMTTEITQEQWTKVMGTNPSIHQSPRRPVEMVTWFDAQQFCETLTQKGKGVYRLPTPEEWRVAASSGLPSDISNVSQTRRFAWCLDDEGDGSHQVATKEASDWGGYDLLGNVSEWCADGYIRGGSFLSSPSGCSPAKEWKSLKDYKANYIGFRVVYEPAEMNPRANHSTVKTSVPK